MVQIFERNAWRPAIQGPKGQFFRYTSKGLRAIPFKLFNDLTVYSPLRRRS